MALKPNEVTSTGSVMGTEAADGFNTSTGSAMGTEAAGGFKT